MKKNERFFSKILESKNRYGVMNYPKHLLTGVERFNLYKWEIVRKYQDDDKRTNLLKRIAEIMKGRL